MAVIAQSDYLLIRKLFCGQCAETACHAPWGWCFLRTSQGLRFKDLYYKMLDDWVLSKIQGRSNSSVSRENTS
jgi:hypothetical protein